MNTLFLRIVTIMMLLLCSQAVFGLLHPKIYEGSSNDETLTGPTLLLYLIVYVSIGIAMAMHRRRLEKIFREEIQVFLLPTLALMSVAWSSAPQLTLRRAAVLLLVTCVAVFLADLYSIEQMCNLVTVVTIAICACTLLLAAISYQIVIDPAHEGAWKGMFIHKNQQGTYMAAAFVTCIHSRFRAYPWLRPIGAAMILTLLFLSRSSTSFVAVVVTLIFLPLMRLVRLPLKQFFVAGTMLAVLGVFMWLYISGHDNDLASLMGKDLTFTGRTNVWLLLTAAIAKRPLLGYGYCAFWNGLRGEALAISSQSGWLVPTAHNGLLELLAGLGFAGVLGFVIGLGVFLKRMITYVRSYPKNTPDPTAPYFWPFTFLILLININCTESLFLNPNDIFWLMYVFSFVAVSKTVRHHRSGTQYNVTAQDDGLLPTYIQHPRAPAY